MQHELIERKNAKQIDKFAAIAGSRLTSNRSEQATTIARDGQAAAVDRAYANALTVCTGHVKLFAVTGQGGSKGGRAVKLFELEELP